MQIVGGGGMETEKREYVGEGSTAISGRETSCDALLHTHRHLHTHTQALEVLWHSEDHGGWGERGDNVAPE